MKPKLSEPASISVSNTVEIGSRLATSEDGVGSVLSVVAIQRHAQEEDSDDDGWIQTKGGEG